MATGTEVEAHELFLYGTNHSDLYRQRTEPIIKNLATKKRKGVFDFQKSLVLWKYWADDAAKRYDKELGPMKFSVAARKLAASEAAEYYAQDIDDFFGPVKNPGKRKITKKPTAKSQATGKRPSKRLVARRAKDTVKGYYPNPPKKPAAKRSPTPYVVEAKLAQGYFMTIGKFGDFHDAEHFAKAYATKHKVKVQVMG
jgi:hypothetical protein